MNHNYQNRSNIAKRMIEKKIADGKYSLAQEKNQKQLNCVTCSMPLMESKGKGTVCVTCPKVRSKARKNARSKRLEEKETLQKLNFIHSPDTTIRHDMDLNVAAEDKDMVVKLSHADECPNPNADERIFPIESDKASNVSTNHLVADEGNQHNKIAGDSPFGEDVNNISVEESELKIDGDSCSKSVRRLREPHTDATLEKWNIIKNGEKLDVPNLAYSENKYKDAIDAHGRRFIDSTLSNENKKKDFLSENQERLHNERYDPNTLFCLPTSDDNKGQQSQTVTKFDRNFTIDIKDSDDIDVAWKQDGKSNEENNLNEVFGKGGMNDSSKTEIATTYECKRSATVNTFQEPKAVDPPTIDNQNKYGEALSKKEVKDNIDHNWTCAFNESQENQEVLNRVNEGVEEQLNIRADTYFERPQIGPVVREQINE